MNRRHLLLCSAAAVAAPLSILPVRAQSTGSQSPIRLIVPFAAGGPIDVTARVLAERAQAALGTIIIDNKPGAGGNVGAALLAKAAPDGLTIGIAATSTHAVNPWLYAQMPFDAAQDFAAITQMVRVPNVLVVNAERAQERGIHTLQDLIAWARSHASAFNYGSGGTGSAGHLAGELFKRQAGIEALHVPYKGGSPAQMALLAGEVDFNIDNLATAAANIKAGKLKALAITSLNESEMLPGVAPLARTFAGFSIDTWWGLAAPAGTPAAVIAQLNRAFTDALQHESTQTRFKQIWAEPVPTSAEQFAAFMTAERAKYKEIVQASGAKID